MHVLVGVAFVDQTHKMFPCQYRLGKNDCWQPVLLLRGSVMAEVQGSVRPHAIQFAVAAVYVSMISS